VIKVRPVRMVVLTTVLGSITPLKDPFFPAMYSIIFRVEEPGAQSNIVRF
jgi:hypothetical protein